MKCRGDHSIPGPCHPKFAHWSSRHPVELDHATAPPSEQSTSASSWLTESWDSEPRNDPIRGFA
eukprot:2155422-Rhodomonas_salina.1